MPFVYATKDFVWDNYASIDVVAHRPPAYWETVSLEDEHGVCTLAFVQESDPVGFIIERVVERRTASFFYIVYPDIEETSFVCVCTTANECAVRVDLWLNGGNSGATHAFEAILLEAIASGKVQ